MYNHQYDPLELRNGEPILRLKTHSNIVLTPPRAEDVTAFIDPMNDPRVYEHLATPPFPYLLEHAIKFVDFLLDRYKAISNKLNAAIENQDLILVDDCPVRIIREIRDDGSDVFIGDIGFMKWNHGELMTPDHTVDWSAKAEWEEKNRNRGVGDPEIIWAIGDFLIPSHHNRGIMTDAVDTLINEWGIPRMGVKHIRLDVFVDNEASAKVFLKNGFQAWGIFDDHVEVRGRKRGLRILEWKYSDTSTLH